MTKTNAPASANSKIARRAGIRALQFAGLFQPARKLVGNGVGRRAHLIARAAAGCRDRREYDPANDWVEVEVA